MRLDVYLVQNGFFLSRSRAKDAINRGHVKLNEKVITKPSKEVNNSCTITITENAQMPKGYFKLDLIQKETGILNREDNVLDLGSSAGGFLLYASTIVAHIKGIEFSLDFKIRLEKIVAQHNNVDIIFADVFTIPINKISTKKVDVILNDMTMEPEISILALKKVLPLLKNKGKILQVLKIQKQDKEPLLSQIEAMGITINHVIEPQTQEIYVIGIKEQ